jgi:small subunit ribosomal protein S9
MVKEFELSFEKKNIGIGRRKQSTARVFMQPGTGTLLINNVVGEKYLQYNTIYLNKIFEPFKVLEMETKYNITVLVNGGGLTGQTDSIQLGVARMIAKLEPDSRAVLKKSGLLTRDARIKERKKYGLRKARKAPQYSKR